MDFLKHLQILYFHLASLFVVMALQTYLCCVNSTIGGTAGYGIIKHDGVGLSRCKHLAKMTGKGWVRRSIGPKGKNAAGL